jgi:hypothetical protein
MAAKDHEVVIPTTGTGSFENPADKATLAQFADKDARDAYLDDDDTSAATTTPPEEDDGEGNAPDLQASTDEAAQASTETDAETDAERAEREADEAAANAQADSEAAATAAKANEQQQLQAPPPVVNPLQFNTRTPQQLKDAADAAKAEKREAFKKYNAGELTDEQYLEVQERVDDTLQSITSEATMLRVQQETSANLARTSLDRLKAEVKAQVDYNADPLAQKQFNRAIDLLNDHPDAEAWTDYEFYQRAHNQVLLLRGHTPGAIAAAPPPPAAPGKPRPAPPNPPLTLREVPNAATANANGGAEEQLGRLKGLDFQHAIGAMPKAQRDAYLDS